MGASLSRCGWVYPGNRRRVRTENPLVKRLDTAGKGPGLVLRAKNHSGAVRVAPMLEGCRAILQILDGTTGVTEVGLNPRELRMLARALLKVATGLENWAQENEATERWFEGDSPTP